MTQQMSELLLSWLRAFAASALAVFLIQIQADQPIDLESVITAGLCAALPPAIRWLDSGDPAFGRGSRDRH